MNLPAINIKMKNHNQFKQDPTPSLDGFGLGIQVFKIESAKNMDANCKSRNRTAIKNIENPIQSSIIKPSIIPKPKKLPTIQKSQSEINPKQRLTALISSKMQSGSHHGNTDKILQKKQPQINSIITPVSYSVRKKVGISTQKKILTNQPGNQTAKPFNVKNVPHDRQKLSSKAKTFKLNQTAPPQMMYKPQQLYYVSIHSQHEVLNRFYSEFQNLQKQNFKQINRLKKAKEFQMDPQAYDRVEYLQSIEGKIDTVIQSMEKQAFEEKAKQMTKLDDRKSKKTINTVVPICGFEISEAQTFDYDPIEKYQLGDFSGSFKVHNYQNVDLSPTTVQPKNNQQQ